MAQARVRAVDALRESFARVNGQDALGTDRYAAAVSANLLYAMSKETQDNFDAGSGQESDGKMRAPHSSSALAVNVFEPWRARPGKLELAGVGSFETIVFEKKCPTGLSGTPPHLDLVAEAADDVVAVESKCLEYLTPKVPHFAPSYQTLADNYGTRSWFRHVEKKTASRSHLDIAQLVKHWLGLCQAYSDRRVTLLYAYWEPQNWRQVAECRRHRSEIQEFADRVAGDAVRFAAISYRELSAEWERHPGAPWVTGHIARLRQRYAVVI